MMNSVIISSILAEDQPAKRLLDIVPQHYFWLGIIILVAFFMLRTTWRRVERSRMHNYLSVEEKVARQKASNHQVIDQAGEYMATLADLSRQINSQIDTRIARLEILMERAEEILERLEKQDGSNEDSLVTGNLAASQVVEISEVDEEEDEVVAPVIEIDYERLSPEAREVIRMADQGNNALEIARRMSRPIGEVELILALAGKKKLK